VDDLTFCISEISPLLHQIEVGCELSRRIETIIPERRISDGDEPGDVLLVVLLVVLLLVLPHVVLIK